VKPTADDEIGSFPEGFAVLVAILLVGLIVGPIYAWKDWRARRRLR
jgi:hypothetical protein